MINKPEHTIIIVIITFKQVYLIASFHFTLSCAMSCCIFNTRRSPCITSSQVFCALPLPPFYYNFLTFLYPTLFVHSFNMSKPPQATLLYAVSYAYQPQAISQLVRRLVFFIFIQSPLIFIPFFQFLKLLNHLIHTLCD